MAIGSRNAHPSKTAKGAAASVVTVPAQNQKWASQPYSTPQQGAIKSNLSGAAIWVTVLVLASAAADAQVVTDLFAFTGANSSQNPGIVTRSEERRVGK